MWGELLGQRDVTPSGQRPLMSMICSLGLYAVDVFILLPSSSHSNQSKNGR